MASRCFGSIQAKTSGVHPRHSTLGDSQRSWNPARLWLLLLAVVGCWLLVVGCCWVWIWLEWASKPLVSQMKHFFQPTTPQHKFQKWGLVQGVTVIEQELLLSPLSRFRTLGVMLRNHEFTRDPITFWDLFVGTFYTMRFEGDWTS